ncbi:hypothetical protein MRB53_027128 [Persea americana]|uniref:Uncharacterized protein n=1 Tax=Persea americana TaxID=3435 RepID=A0ACC2LK03_PERAE|nr:hypothetical protein MRB53_027128 [Persea americana]
MAVQAQYPSNVLLLNRNGQELQLQAEDILNQSQVLYSNGAEMDLNPRKRMREIAETPVSLFQLQSQPPPPTLIDLAQLHNPPPAVVSTGLRLAFEDQQQHQQQMGLFFPSSTAHSSFLPEDLVAQIKQQRDEIDQILKTQGEQLRRTLAEGRRRHHRQLRGAVEESAARRLREKAAEVEKAARRRAELEERVALLKAEADAWEARARAQEAAAAALQLQLRQAMAAAGGGAQDKEGDELGCTGEAEDAESAHVDPGRVVSGAPPCQVCRYRGVSVLLLPCRHLCVCNACETVVDACPICHCLRSASVEVYLS